MSSSFGLLERASDEMRLRRNSSSPHSSLSPGRTAKTGDPTSRGGLRRSQRAESSSPKAAERPLRTRSTSGRGLLDGSGFLSDEERGKKEEEVNGSLLEPRRSSRKRNLKYNCFDADYMTNEDVIRHKFQVKRGVMSWATLQG